MKLKCDMSFMLRHDKVVIALALTRIEQAYGQLWTVNHNDVPRLLEHDAWYGITMTHFSIISTKRQHNVVNNKFEIPRKIRILIRGNYQQQDAGSILIYKPELPAESPRPRFWAAAPGPPVTSGTETEWAGAGPRP